MGTPATAFASVIHTVVIWFGVLWISALVISRVYMFHDAYQRILQRLETDMQLRASCHDPAFVQMMQQHPEVCARALHEAEVNPWLAALNVAANTPTLCGDEPCTSIVTRIFTRGGWTAIGCAMLVIIFSPQVLMPLLYRAGPRLAKQDSHWPVKVQENYAGYPQYPGWCKQEDYY